MTTKLHVPTPEERRERICTTVAQSRELVAAGIDPNTADMTWSHCQWTPAVTYGEDEYTLFAYPDAKTSHDPTGIPAWSARALMDILPATLPDPWNADNDCRLTVRRSGTSYEALYDGDDISSYPVYVNAPTLITALTVLVLKVCGRR